MIIKPINKNKAIDEKLWDNEINIPLNIPHELNDKVATNTKFKCNIDEKAIIKTNLLRNRVVVKENNNR